MSMVKHVLVVSLVFLCFLLVLPAEVRAEKFPPPRIAMPDT